MDLRIGVLNHTILQHKLRAKKYNEKGGNDNGEAEEELTHNLENISEIQN